MTAPVAAVPFSGPLNEAQLQLLQLFSKPMSSRDLDELRELLLDFYFRKITAGADLVWAEKGLTPPKMDDFAKKHPARAAQKG